MYFDTGSSVQTPTPTAPRMRFGNAQRGAADKIFISAQHEKSSVGRDSPGVRPHSIACLHATRHTFHAAHVSL